MTTYAVYNVEDEIAAFFTKTSVARQTCDDRARDLAGGTVTPIKIQGFCSYSVYAGPNVEYVLQFRPKSLEHAGEAAVWGPSSRGFVCGPARRR